MKKNKQAFIVFAAIFLADQLSKALIRLNLEPGSSQIISELLSITYVTNTGVAFGLFKGMNFLFIIISVIVLGFLVYVLKKGTKFSTLVAVAAAGTAGNLVDRIFLGHVVDFIAIWRFPVFNIADAAITFGIISLLLVSMKTGEDIF
jgi:signal peptidase II